MQISIENTKTNHEKGRDKAPWEREEEIADLADIGEMLLSPERSLPIIDLPPIWQRGVQIEWLFEFGDSQSRYSATGLSTREIVTRVIHSLTKGLNAPLYARVPEEFRGMPRHVLSHAWDDYFMREFGFGMMSILEHRFDEADYVWIDLACHNLHTDEMLPENLEKTISEIGSVQFLINEPVLFKDSQGMLELLQAYRVGATMAIQIAGGHPTDHIYKCEQAMETFSTDAKAEAAASGLFKESGEYEEAAEQMRRMLSSYRDELHRRFL